MFESLTEKLTGALRNLRGVGKLTDENMADALKEVRAALLAADVHFKVTREFIERVQTACVGQAVLKSVSPGQQVVKIINDELVKLLGEGTTELAAKRPADVALANAMNAVRANPKWADPVNWAAFRLVGAGMR